MERAVGHRASKRRRGARGREPEEEPPRSPAAEPASQPGTQPASPPSSASATEHQVVSKRSMMPLPSAHAAPAAGVKEGPPPADWRHVGIFYYDPERIHPRQIRRLQEIAGFFTETNVTRILVPVAKAEFDVSLRLLDYCCTNYAKKTRVVICEDRKSIHLFSLYKDWLRHYRRRTFDPFRRRERICFPSPPPATEWLETTVAQLNFLRWADLYGVIRYVRRNLQQIEKDMMKTLLDSKQRRHVRIAAPHGSQEAVGDERTEQGAKRKRTELSRHPTSKCVVYLVPQSILFEEEEE